MMMKNKGFTLIELMIVVVIIGILSAIALPAYRDYVVRSRVVEGLSVAASAKAILLDVSSSNDIKGRIGEWNSFSGGKGSSSKYVKSVLFNDDAVITIEYDSSIGIPATNNQLSLEPYLAQGNGTFLPLVKGIAAGASGPIDWACSSETNTTATRRSMTTTIPVNPLAAKYAPVECR